MSEKVKSRLIRYLPSIYQENTFLEEFLLAFEKVIYDGWKSDEGNGNNVAGFDAILNTIDRCFIPSSRDTDHPGNQTDPEFLPWLAKWVDLTLDEEWGEKERRENISRAMDLYRWRGTVKGLKEYLKIYAGLEPEIRECRWPAGMQIGIASMIGGVTLEYALESFSAEQETAAHADYYVITEQTPPGTAFYYLADQAGKITLDLEENKVTVDYISPAMGITRRIHNNATATRRDGLADNRYTLTGMPTSGEAPIKATYAGDTVFIDEEDDVPYRFIVDVKLDPAKLDPEKSISEITEKIRAIVDLEKPAHTLYYLKLTLGRTVTAMQIAVHSTIAIDTTIG
jgi:phage tail-like protein